MKQMYDEDFIIENCLLVDIDYAETLLGEPHCYDEGIDDGCSDGSYTMYRSYDNDSDRRILILYYNSEDYLVYDYAIRQN